MRDKSRSWVAPMVPATPLGFEPNLREKGMFLSCDGHRRGRPSAIAVLVVLLLGSNALGQTTQSLDTKGTLVITLGTAGGPRPRVDRAQSANLVVVNGKPYLVDVGENVVRRLTQAGVNILGVDQVFITHGHSDHTLGLPALLATQWEFQRRKPIEIIGPPGTSKLVADALIFLSSNSAIRFAEGFPSPIDNIVKVSDAMPGIVFQDENVTVHAVENTHFHFPEGSPAFGRFKSYSYRFSTSDRSIVFTGDTGPSPEVTALAKGADLLVSEVMPVEQLVELYKKNGTWQAKSPEEQAGWLRHQMEEHLSPEAVGQLAVDAGVKKVVLTHLVPIESEQGYKDVAERVARIFHGPVLIAKDLAKY